MSHLLDGREYLGSEVGSSTVLLVWRVTRPCPQRPPRSVSTPSVRVDPLSPVSRPRKGQPPPTHATESFTTVPLDVLLSFLRYTHRRLSLKVRLPCRSHFRDSVPTPPVSVPRPSSGQPTLVSPAPVLHSGRSPAPPVHPVRYSSYTENGTRGPPRTRLPDVSVPVQGPPQSRS